MAAYTVEDAVKLQATGLKLVHKKLCALPAGLASLQHLRSLDASNNPQLQLKELQDKQQPPAITTLILTGCSLSEVPQCLSRLTGLSDLQLAANNITQADAVFACPGLLHAGLSFNHISSINTVSLTTRNRNSTAGHTASTAGPAAVSQHSRGRAPAHKSSTAAGKRTAGSSSPQPTSASISCKGGAGGTTTGATTCHANHISTTGSCPASTAACTSCSSPLMSLDLSHNDMTDLPAVLTQLQQITALRSLSLKGNPASLAAGYREAVLQALPQLLYLDGQKLDGINVPAAGSRPGTTSSRRRPGSAKPAAATAGGQAAEVQPVVFTSGSTLCPTAVQARTVPLLLRLELGRQQLAELSEHAFALVAADSSRKLQQLLQEAAAVADCYSSDRSTGGSSATGDSSSNAPSGQTQNAEKSPTKTINNAAPSEAHAAALTPSSSDAACPTAAPLKPIAYHVEIQGPDGAQMCSTALTIQPPAVAAADAATPASAVTSADSKKAGVKGKPTSQDSKAAGSAAAKPRPGSSVKSAAGKSRTAAEEGAAAAAAGAASQQLQGGLQVLLQLPLSVAGRDYLRGGFSVRLIRTHYEPCAVLQPPPAAVPASAAPAAGAAAGKRVPSAKAATGANSKPGKAVAASAAPDAIAFPATAAVWQYEMKQQVLGTAQVVAADLGECCGEQQTSEGSMQFLPPAPLFSTATGTLLSLKEASHKLKPIGSCNYRLVLHHQATAG